MSLNTKVGVLAGAATIAMTATGFAGTTPSNTDARIAALESQIAEIKTQSGSMLNDEQIRAIVQDAMADSETRSSFLQGGGAGYQAGKGFYLSNGDGSFDMWINAMFQTRAIWNNKDSADESNFGFEASRTRLTFGGHAGPDLTYFIQSQWGRDGGTFTLLDACLNWDMGDGWNLGWGQARAPFLREQLMSAGTQLAVDRSYVHAMATASRTQGAWLNYNADTWRFWLAFSDGAVANTAGANGGNHNTAWNVENMEWALTARFDVLLDGSDWSQFNDYTSWSGDNTAWYLGGAVHWQDNEYGTGTEETEVFMWTVDTQVEYGGANVAAYVVGLHTSPNLDSAAEYEQLGFVVQGGYQLVPDKFEWFGRYEWFDFDGAIAGFDDEFSAFTTGFNYYFTGSHQWKWTTDVIFAFDEVPAAASGLGMLADTVGDEDQVVFRSQFQVLTK